MIRNCINGMQNLTFYSHLKRSDVAPKPSDTPVSISLMHLYVFGLLIMFSSARAYRFMNYSLRMPLRRVLSDLASPKVESARPSVFTSVSFFRFVEINDEEVDKVISLAKESFQKKSIRGTLLLSNEGYNGQFALPAGGVMSFRADLAAINRRLFEDLDVNVGNTIDYDATATPFPFKKLIVRRKKGALTDGLSEEISKGIDWTQPGPEMPAKQWHETVTGAKNNPIVLLDCRNNYESDIGLFEGATPLNTTYFSETWDKLHEMLEGFSKDTKILTYCTGGIRCVKVNAYLQQKMGFTNTHRLQGGIIAYDQWIAQQERPSNCSNDGEVSTQPLPVESCFKGQNFLFDRRRLKDPPAPAELNKSARESS